MGFVNEGLETELEFLSLYKKRLKGPELEEYEFKEILEDILRNELEELTEELVRASVRYNGISKYVDLVRSYFNGETKTLLETFTIADAPVLYFLISNLKWSLDEFPDVSLLISTLKYHVRTQVSVEDKNLRKEYIRLYRLSIYHALNILVDLGDALDLETTLEKDEELEKLMIFWNYEILDQFSKIYETRKESPYYKKLGWFKRWAICGYLSDTKEALYVYQSKKMELEGKSSKVKRINTYKKRNRKK
ncbi:hypothetical protein ACO2J1_18825 [Leptospira interrogans]|uniref:Uncharacterized protein n=4 Tax=Leptospira interrogans TaxID=173 RepID=M6RQ85_LEPIR|nr:hypothetical protein [Leptospira interrogans]APH40487.1 Uncharacterized protein A9P81_0546 [Leptospira interrogans serovar Copenhageni/Icterohaemorrhagiae]EMG21044.1 hypothetical protein LEP1GSC150_4390 [Leptospira interrogans serovar Copenhageni str. LT2050]EMO06704.1 hypothetical protein LEP1GSC116_1643 [Leptospira interrogans serovar Icterohaemorrhagiae str. Verdun HP]AAS69125.1 hypothetical protein LIC_10504 [Leptospira interrogans serovar Copenhageni str. Fiocruz L1-130]ARB96566.1 hypo